MWHGFLEIKNFADKNDLRKHWKNDQVRIYLFSGKMEK
jgi:hypothetical protein